jgi:hypothetical protein
MANTFGKAIYLDTFTAAIDVNKELAGASGFRIKSIEFQKPTTAGHTCAITNEQGETLFSETCVTANQSIIKYFGGDGLFVSNIKVAVAAGDHMASGAIVINRA